MTLQSINLDDRTYDQLLDELKKHIPGKEWTDHNPSDPGIMLIELLSWLGEMSLYKMNRVPDAHQEKFLKLVLDPPEAVIVPIKLEFISPQNEEFVVPAGIRFATDFKNNKRYIYETFNSTVIKKHSSDVMPPYEDHPRHCRVLARSLKEIKNEALGISDGSPNQVFTLKHSPVLLDFVNNSTVYKPNPEIQVGAELWELKQFLLTDDSQVIAPNDARHFMIDDFDNKVRFGDGVFGAIPPLDDVIVCKRYQVLEGPEALIKAGEIKHILDPIPGLDTNETVTLTGNEDAEGGINFFKKEERFSKGLENYKKTYRLITKEDFENIILNDFNELQDMTRTNAFNELSSPYPASLNKISRAIVLMNKKPFGSELEKQTGHVTLLILPEFEQNKNLPFVTQEQVDIDPLLEEKIIRFLDKRRLITTRLHLKSISLINIRISIHVVIKKEQNETGMEQIIRQKIYDLFDIIQGYFDNKGWPPGRNVYKSELYRLVEEIGGVDHVSSLELSPPAVTGDINLKEQELPTLAELNIVINRL